jgi:hypothetical protein
MDTSMPAPAAAGPTPEVTANEDEKKKRLAMQAAIYAGNNPTGQLGVTTQASTQRKTLLGS